MINCPNCNTPNEPGTRFCINCGAALATAPTTGSAGLTPRSETALGLLSISTARLIIAVFLLYLFRGIFMQLSFTRELFIAGFPLTVPQMMDILVNVITLVLVLGYAQSLRALWPQALPHLTPLTPVLVTLIYIVTLAVLYTALKEPVALFSDETDLIVIIRVVMVVLALLLLGWAWASFYQVLPDWLGTMPFRVALSATSQAACLNCGHLNLVGLSYCGTCGSLLGGSSPSSED